MLGLVAVAGRGRAGLVERVVAAATSPDEGVVRIDASAFAGGAGDVRAVVQALRGLGLVCVRTSRVPADAQVALAKRHVALLVLHRDDWPCAAAVVRVLARTERRHVLVHFVGLPAERVAPGRGDDRLELAAVDALIARQMWRGASARLAAIAVASACRGHPVPRGVVLREAEVLFRMGRLEEAARRLEGCPRSRKSARLGALVSSARGHGRRRRLVDPRVRWPVGDGSVVMNLLPVVPRLLQLVRETEDEGTLMRRACEWMCESTGAMSAAVVAREGSRVVAARGLEPHEIVWSEIEAACRHATSKTVAAEGWVRVTAPVRYAGAAIGAVVGRAPVSRAETLVEAVTTVASLLPVALRTRLDAMAVVHRGRTLAGEILGDGAAAVELRESVARAAASAFPVLIEGESGTGKELVARALHRLSARRDRRFCAVNCAALTDDLIESEMFGHVRGAFTGAIGPRPGLFEEAHGGTLLLDEVADLSARGQAKLLRVLQEREVRRVGENAPRSVDVRIVGATNVGLTEAVSRGRFREDLRFRLAVIRIHVPPLRDRIEDVPLLAQVFWRRLSAEAETRAALGPDAVASLCRHTWPGNIRELQNVVSALVVAAPPRGLVTGRHVAIALGAAGTEMAAVTRLDAAVRGFERRVVAAALARNGGRRTRTARELGLSRQGLTKAIRRLGLRPPDRDAAGVA